MSIVVVEVVLIIFATERVGERFRVNPSEGQEVGSVSLVVSLLPKGEDSTVTDVTVPVTGMFCSVFPKSRSRL